MANTPSNIQGGFRPMVYFGAANADPPEHVDIPDDEVYAHFGLISDDGITFSKSIEQNKVRAMGITNYYVYTQITGQESTISLTFMETRSEVLSVFNRVNTSLMTTTPAVTGGSAHPQYVTMLDEPINEQHSYSMIIDLTSSKGQLHRRFYPVVQVSDTSDLSYTTTGDPLGYQMTFDIILGDDGAVPVEKYTNLVLNEFPL